MSEKQLDNHLVYVTWAYRWGNEQGYNFLVYVSRSKESAIEAAHTHRTDRGGKYRHIVVEASEDTPYDGDEAKVVWSDI